MKPTLNLADRWTWLLVVSLLFLSACDTSSPATEEVDSGPVELLHAWIEVDPPDVGLSEDALDAAISAARQIQRLKSFLIIKDGKLVEEHYLHGALADDLHDVRSVTKSIVSAIVGIAISEGKIPSIDTPIGNHLDFISETIPDDFKTITFKDLLTMTGGWADENVTSTYGRWISSGDPEGWLVSEPRTNSPGSTFSYTSAGVHLLAVLTGQYLDQSFVTYADARFFSRIGIINREWEMLSSGYPNGGAGIDLQARDLAKIGQLFLQRGASGERQIIPSEWVDASTTPKFTWQNSYAGLSALSYGYLWWTDLTDFDRSYFAWGYGGQFIFVSPSRNLVIVTTTDWSGVTSEPGGEQALARSVMNVITDQVLPAISPN